MNEPIGSNASAGKSCSEGRASSGELDTPKTGRREIPIAPPLACLLAPVAEGPRDRHVAPSKRGKPWGQYAGHRHPSTTQRY